MINNKLKIGVDIDGVLGDQVSPLLEKINRKYYTNLSKEDVIEWDFKINDTNIEIEINNALHHSDYILNMPIIDGSIKGMKYLFSNYYVVIASSRPEETERDTLKWLKSKFNFHKYINTHKSGKGSLDVDILIDDNLSNIESFSNNNGIGILLFQPWNKECHSIKKLIEKKRVFCCKDWIEIISILKTLNK